MAIVGRMYWGRRLCLVLIAGAYRLLALVASRDRERLGEATCPAT
jgi:hypothetical protein